MLAQCKDVGMLAAKRRLAMFTDARFGADHFNPQADNARLVFARVHPPKRGLRGKYRIVNRRTNAVTRIQQRVWRNPVTLSMSLLPGQPDGFALRVEKRGFWGWRGVRKGHPNQPTFTSSNMYPGQTVDFYL